jgi:hypothetical protein
MRQQSTAKVLHRVSKPKRAALGAHKDVHIIDNNGHVKPDPVDIYKSSGDQVLWIADTGPAVVEFSPTDCPFYKCNFNVAAGGSVPSGPIRDDAQAKRYKYSVKGQTGPNDPVVIIHN